MKQTIFIFQNPGFIKKLLLCFLMAIFYSAILVCQPSSSACNGGSLQGDPPIGDCNKIINIELVMLIDQAFVNKYGGNVALARSKAEYIFDLMSSGLHDAIFAICGFYVSFSLNHFPFDVAPNNWKTGGWSINGFWGSNAKRCIRYDGKIMLSGQDLGFDGGADGGPLCGSDDITFFAAVSAQFGESTAAMTLAHEILHGLNLGHINAKVTDMNGNIVNSTTCGVQCNSSMAPLMCTSGADVYKLTACDLICLRFLFDAPRCECLSKIYPGFYPEFECGDLPKITLASNQMFLAKGCNNKRNTLDFMVVLDGSALGITNATFRIKYKKDIYDWISTNGDFDTEISVDNFHNELLLKVNNDPNGVEELISLQPDEEKILHFSLLFNPDIVDATINNGKTEIIGTFSNNNISISSVSRPQACIPVSGAVTLLPGTEPIIVTNDLILVGSDIPFEINTPLILVDNGASISLSSAEVRTYPNKHTVVEGCATMWKGFVVPAGNILDLNNTVIKDASNAVSLSGGGSLFAKNTAFFDNIIGIKSFGNNILSLKGNQFITSPLGIKPPYLGQSPNPSPKGFAGIYINGNSAGLNIQKDIVSGASNQFSNLYYGILAENTNITVRDALFDDIIKEPRPFGYPGPLFTGSAVHLTGGIADLKGSYAGVALDPIAMRNCHTGVNVLGGSIDVAGCEMENMTNGIVAGGGTNKPYTVYWNNITASEHGISVFYQSGLPGQSSINNNIVTMSGNPNGVGIANGGHEMFPQQEGFVVNNSVTMEEGATGIQIGVANRLNVTYNNVNLSSSNSHFGIKVEGGDRNTLNCNTVTSAGGANDGIYAVHASRASVLCNLTTGTARGLNFEGMLSGKNKADIAGNRMVVNAVAGLLLGTDAVTGEQVHRGNKFEGTEALAGGQAFFHSKFTVDADENSSFLPDAWLPINWFVNTSNPSPSFDCGANTTCPPTPAPTPDYPLDLKIVKGELGGTLYQAANKWLSQRRFYELVIEEGNPYPGNSDVSAFLSQAQTNGLNSYASIQVGIRQLGAMNEGNRATAAANLLTLNTALAGNASYQVNEKLVNQIFLQTVAIGNLEFSETQIALLEGIATLCPLSDGEAVLRSRAMLQLIQGTPADYDDLFICGGGERSGSKKMTGQSSIRVYPNPANDVLTIDFQSIGELSGQFLMFNALGQIIKEIALHPNDGITQLPLQGFSDGVYWYVVPGLGAGKILIQH
jgi:Secretion system C-terminal sorting domain